MIPVPARSGQGDGSRELAFGVVQVGGSMFLTLCKSKLHRATVTQAELAYEGSITIDAELLRVATILPFERVQVVDVANGARFETYAIAGRPGSGTVCVNGAAARLVQVGDPVIIISYAQFTPEEARQHEPVLVFLNPDNSVAERVRASHGAPVGAGSYALSQDCRRRARLL